MSTESREQRAERQLVPAWGYAIAAALILGADARAQQCGSSGANPAEDGCWSQKYCPLAGGDCNDTNIDRSTHAVLVGAGAAEGNQGSVLIWRGNWTTNDCSACGPEPYHKVHRWRARSPGNLPMITKLVEGIPPEGGIYPEDTILGYNIFCSHHTFDAAGRLVIVGALGHPCCATGPAGEPGDGLWRWSFVLDTNLDLFDAGVDPWIGPLTPNPDPPFGPSNGWFYPTCITLGDGRILAGGGGSAGYNPEIDECDLVQYPGQCAPHGDDDFSDEVHLFDPSTDTWAWPAGQGLTGHLSLTLYPHLYQLESGLVFCAHTMSNDFGWYDTPLRQAGSYTFDPDNPQELWVTRDTNNDANGEVYRTYPTGAYLPRMTPNADERVVLISGADPDSDPPGEGTSTVYCITNPDNGGVWEAWPSLNVPRVFANVVLLPDGRLLVVGGSLLDYEDWENGISPVFTPEILDPSNLAAGWQTVASHASPRQYHSWALLLPDGRVMVGGGDDGEAWDPDLESDYEIYEPDYLFGGTHGRPEITSVPSGPIAYDTQFTVEVRIDIGDSIEHLVLVRGGSVTHHFNSEQRVLGLAKSGYCSVIQGTNFKTCTFTVTAPEDGNHAPPGYYMLFALNEESQPSVAEFVQLLEE